MFFQFKQFHVAQEQAAMKVCTDSCILGAYAEVSGANHVLDIGTGTGLLALMLAQRSTAFIEAVEIEESAFEQARANMQNSPFTSRVRVYHEAVQTFQPKHHYEVIVCNPPFFERHLKSSDYQRNIALHNDTLTLQDLALHLNRLLTPEGKAYILLPAYQTSQFLSIAQSYGLYPQEQLHIYQNPEKQKKEHIFRIITTLSKEQAATHNTYKHLCIKDNNQCYSLAFKKLLQDYYLIF